MLKLNQEFPAESIPNPKPSACAKGPAPWYRFYAMFSEAFASHVLKVADLSPGSLILDPWLGVGTTTAVAASHGFRSVGIDVNPVMVAVARGRSTSRDRALTALAKVLDSRRPLGKTILQDEDPLNLWFGRRTAGAIREWEQLFADTFAEQNDSDVLGFLLTVLFEAVGKLAKPYRSRNPTWIKQPAPTQRIEVEPRNLAALIRACGGDKSLQCAEVPPRYQPSIHDGSSTSMSLASESVDLVLTSPPYCTRIDYAVSTQIELAILKRDRHELRTLRDKTMGTSTIRSAPIEVQESWGSHCIDFINRITVHPSKASGTYYRKTYLQYFNDLAMSLFELSRCARDGAQIVVVVQDSYYKGIHLDLPAILSEMASSCALSLSHSVTFPIQRSMRRVNTKSRTYRSDCSASETALWFLVRREKGSRNARLTGHPGDGRRA